ncbi:CRB_1a_G0054650.mRNA.1.CDS.1 [Saccharomyces cerevisiae]|nr:CRB_1a_G0054650.mRNA.1.CDS.1 [Saccharomyces cerevisiae]CAI7479473.1 CRB_1a_G0054650.mRNA.1.CDS.1 [Saccharomyces cerevisiae]
MQNVALRSYSVNSEQPKHTFDISKLTEMKSSNCENRRKFTDDKLIPVDTEKRIRISFTSEVSQILPWKFVPQQRRVYVLPGETALAFYKAKNYSDKDIIGMATYSIAPGETAQCFNKIQCFCFEEQKASCRAHYGDGTAVSDSKKEPEMNADEKAASLANAAILSPEVIDTRKDNSN